jgi:hypothetical protein
LFFCAHFFILFPEFLPNLPITDSDVLPGLHFAAVFGRNPAGIIGKINHPLVINPLVCVGTGCGRTAQHQDYHE